ncbi:MAG: hypothetical protein KGH72_04370 [Candidatus Micrarchaeota archaeon]|nr:hypothetical protein [Candidatus Micrarchaeota archaeon]
MAVFRARVEDDVSRHALHQDQPERALLATLRGGKAQVLVTGPSGVGKTTLSRFFAARGEIAFDGDVIDGLGRTYHIDGRPMLNAEGRPRNANAYEWLHMQFAWRWDVKVIKAMLSRHDRFFLFGSADNIDECVSLFGTAYYLKASPLVISKRLQSDDRDNPTGKDAGQRKLIVGAVPYHDAHAERLGFTVVDASLPPIEIFDIIAAAQGSSNGKVSGPLTRIVR